MRCAVRCVLRRKQDIKPSFEAGPKIPNVWVKIYAGKKLAQNGGNFYRELPPAYARFRICAILPYAGQCLYVQWAYNYSTLIARWESWEVFRSKRLSFWVMRYSAVEREIADADFLILMDPVSWIWGSTWYVYCKMKHILKWLKLLERNGSVGVFWWEAWEDGCEFSQRFFKKHLLPMLVEAESRCKYDQYIIYTLKV